MIEICAFDREQNEFVAQEIDDAKEERKVKEFKIGEKVRIRQWDDMAKEFGVNSSGDINCSVIFSQRMRHLCGKKATIIYMIEKNVYLENEEGSSYFQYSFTTDMIEHIEEKEMKFKVGDTVMTEYGVGEIIDIIENDTPYLVRIYDHQMLFAEYELELIEYIGKEIDKKDTNFSASDTQTKEENKKDDIVDKFDKVGNVVEKMVPIVSYIFLASLMSIFVICVTLMILGACGIITVNYRVLGSISVCLFLLIMGIAFAIITE